MASSTTQAQRDATALLVYQANIAPKPRVAAGFMDARRPLSEQEQIPILRVALKEAAKFIARVIHSSLDDADIADALHAQNQIFKAGYSARIVCQALKQFYDDAEDGQ